MRYVFKEKLDFYIFVGTFKVKMLNYGFRYGR